MRFKTIRTMGAHEFQFHLGSIKSLTRSRTAAQRVSSLSFNSILVRLKTSLGAECADEAVNLCFNSILVRLKTSRGASARRARRPRFNSILVRLRASLYDTDGQLCYLYLVSIPSWFD